MAGLVLLGLTTLMPIDGNPVKIVAAAVVILIAGIYVLLAFWTKKKPYTAILTALIIFICLEVLGAIVQPASIFQGWIVKIVILILLLVGLRNAKDTQRMMATFGKNK
jgi:hypothetical protein